MDELERVDGRHGTHHALERCASLETRQAASEVFGLDAGKNGGWIAVGDQPTLWDSSRDMPWHQLSRIALP